MYMKIWKCPNCGQYHFSDVPPDMCDFCHDFTTWRLCSVVYPDDEIEQQAASIEPIENDTLLQLAIELGAVIVEDETGSGAAPADGDFSPGT